MTLSGPFIRVGSIDYAIPQTLFARKGAIVCEVTDNTAIFGGGIYNDHGTAEATGGSITGNVPDDCVDYGGTGCPP